MEILFKNENEISEDWLKYIEAEAKSLAENSSELEIEGYMDRELLNPQMIEFLSLKEINISLAKEVENTNETLVLNTVSMSRVTASPSFLNFKKLKGKIRRIFCAITKDLNNMDWKDIIKKILVALIPAFSGGVPALIIPVVTALVALLIKKGYNAVCPT